MASNNKNNKYKDNLRIDNESSPDTFMKAILQAIFKLPAKIRWAILLIVSFFLVVLTIWSNLPTSIQEDLIGYFIHDKINSSQKAKKHPSPETNYEEIDKDHNS